MVTRGPRWDSWFARWSTAITSPRAVRAARALQSSPRVRFLVVLALASGCYVQGRGQFSNTYGGGGGGFGFMATDEHQDGELGMELGSSRTPPVAGEIAAPSMTMIGVRYAHAVDPRGIVRLYARGAVGWENCPTDKMTAQQLGCVPTATESDPLDVPGTSFSELGGGVAFTYTRHDETDPIGWYLMSLSIGVVHSSSTTVERGSGDFTGVDIALTLGFDALAPFASFKKHD